VSASAEIAGERWQVCNLAIFDGNRLKNNLSFINQDLSFHNPIL
jgi:hypothetical protein